jgi:ATP-binding cassette subfamily B protein
MRSASVLVERAMKKTYIDPTHLSKVEATTLRRILTYITPYRARATGVLCCIVAASVLNLALPWFAKRIVDVAIPTGDLRLLWLYCAGMVAGPVAAGLFQVAQKYGAETIGQGVMFDLRVALYRRLHEMPFAFFAKQAPGESVSRVLNDVQGAGGVVSDTLVDVAQNAIVLAATTAFVLALDWRLALMSVGFLPIFITPTRKVGKRRKALKRRVQERVGELTGILTETLSVSGALLVKVFGAERAEIDRFQKKAAELRRLSLEQSLVGRWFRMLLGSFEAVGPAIVFGLGGFLVIKGEIPLGTIVAFVTVIKRLYSPASQLANVHVDLLTGYAYFDRVFEALDRSAPIQDPRSVIVPASINGRIEFRDVSFRYGDVEDALSDVTLTIPAGSTVAFVGPSGAGKTTLASLVARLYDPTNGVVTVDGIDVRRIGLPTLRSHIAIVTQETFLFHTTVFENLRYGRPSASQTEVEAAARRAHIHDVIAALPQGYQTLVGERGYRFSGGERQRLAIARAILKDPRILVLDEATSALDSAAEQQVQVALAPLLKGRTSLIVAHRLSTICNADLIFVLDGGCIVERGTHEQLLAQAGLYAWLWWAQARQDPRRPAPAIVASAFEGGERRRMRRP